MSGDINIVHLSDSPLVGSPGKISEALNRVGINSISYVRNDYPTKPGGLGGLFINNSIVINQNSSHQELSSFYENLKLADIIHIHNWFDIDFFKDIYKYCYNSKFVYQVHSPLREGPLFDFKDKYFPVDFSAKLVVAQYQPRLYQDYTLVPNIVLEKPFLKLRDKRSPLKVIYSPSHSRSGRWNSKGTEEVDGVLSALESSGSIDVFRLNTPLSPNVLFQIRKNYDVTIDEIVTGAFHQVSLEGLCAGNIVINNADIFSREIFSSVAGANEIIPFITADKISFLDSIKRLSDDVEYCNKIKKISYDFFNNFLYYENLIKRYTDVYNEVLS